MSKKDYYSILGLNKDCSADEIKSAYRKLAMKHHPDKKGGDSEKFKEINEAYTVLSDPQKRQQHDNPSTPFDMSDMFQGGGFSFDDIFGGGFGGFGDVFGGGRKTSYVKKGGSIRVKVNLTLEDVLSGVSKKIKINRNIICNKCNGTGDKSKQVHTCTKCNGSGQISEIKRSPFGQIRSTVDCNMCNGSGRISKDKCPSCHGSGVELVEDIVSINIPAGVEDGMTLKVDGKGNMLVNGLAGDLILLISVLQHNLFKRQDSNLVLNYKIGIIDSIIGCDVDIPTLDGNKVRIHIDASSEHGKVFRIRDKGLTSLNSSRRGDMFVQLDVKIPKKLTPNEIILLNQLRNSENFKN